MAGDNRRDAVQYWHRVQDSESKTNMTNRYRFSDYQRAAGMVKESIPAGQLYPDPERDASGRIIRIRRASARFSRQEIFKLFQPYVIATFHGAVQGRNTFGDLPGSVSSTDPAPVGGRLMGNYRWSVRRHCGPDVFHGRAQTRSHAFWHRDRCNPAAQVTVAGGAVHHAAAGYWRDLCRTGNQRPEDRRSECGSGARSRISLPC